MVFFSLGDFQGGTQHVPWFVHPSSKNPAAAIAPSRLEGQAVGIDLDVLEFPEPEFVMRLYLGVVVFFLFFFR